MEFLKYFITEDIYLVPDNRETKNNLEASGDKMEKAFPAEEASKKESKEAFPLAVVSKDLAPKEEELLKAILSAVKLNLKAIKLLKDIAEDPCSDKVIVFNSELIPELTPYTITNMQGKLYLSADDLSTISNNVDKKKKLWVALQQMFSL